MTIAQDSDLLIQAQELIVTRQFKAAIGLLEQQDGHQPSGEETRCWPLPITSWKSTSGQRNSTPRPVALAPGNEDWQLMRAQAHVNATAQLDEPIPPYYLFNADSLLRPPDVPAGTLPEPPQFHHRPGILRRFGRAIGDFLGWLVAIVMNGLIWLVGKLFGYRDEVWTNWYHRPLILGILTLAYMREQLNEHNLNNTYPKGRLTGFQPEGQTPPPGVTHFRTADGTLE